MDIPDQTEVMAFLKSGKAYGADSETRRVDTHAASVFLCGERAWKLKRAVRFAYLDFSTPEKRRKALETELRLNRRTAPDLYLAVHPIRRTYGNELAIGGEGEAVDWLLEMRRFPDGARLDRVAERGELTPALLMLLADRIAEFHTTTASRPTVGGRERLEAVVRGNSASLAAFPGLFPHSSRAALLDAQLQECRRFGGRLDRRAREGLIRHVHGDLHLANIALVAGEPTPFDCLEFDEELATTDVLYDLAFLLMDLWQRGLKTEANIIFNRYFDRSCQGREDDAALLPLFLSIRATIRAHVTAAQAERGRGGARLSADAAHLFGLAQELLSPGEARMAAIGGLSGTGKSTLARTIGAKFRPAPGARILRTDIIRKQLAGLAPEATLPEEAYTPESGRAVYHALTIRAKSLLAAGWPVIADAVFARPAEREAIGAAAEGYRFDGIWLDLPVDERAGRVAGRMSDASDADAAVVRRQAGYELGSFGNWTRMAANRPVGELSNDLMARLIEVTSAD